MRKYLNAAFATLFAFFAFVSIAKADFCPVERTVGQQAYMGAIEWGRGKQFPDAYAAGAECARRVSAARAAGVRIPSPREIEMGFAAFSAYCRGDCRIWPGYRSVGSAAPAKAAKPRPVAVQREVTPAPAPRVQPQRVTPVAAAPRKQAAPRRSGGHGPVNINIICERCN